MITLTPTKKKLDNGINLITIPSSHSSLCWFSLRLRGGTDFEKSCWANHSTSPGSFFLLSQMFFSSGAQLTQKELILLQKKNAIEHFSVTNEGFFGFNLSFLKDKTEEMIKVLQAVTTRNKFVKKEFDLEKKELIFHLERENENGEKLSQKAFHRHFFQDSPYEIGIYGTKETLAPITKDHLWDLWQDYFSPQGAVAVIAGKIDKTEKKTIEKTLIECLPKNQTPNAHNTISNKIFYKKDFINRLKKIKNRVIVEKYPNGKQTFVKLGFATPCLKEKEISLARIIQAFLNGMGGPLFRLRSENYVKNGKSLGGCAYVIGAKLMASFGYGGLIFYTALREEANQEWSWAIESFLSEVKTLRCRKIPEKKINEAKRALKASRYLRMGKIAYRAANYATYESYGLGFKRWEQEIDALESIHSEDILRFCQKYLVEDNYIAHVFSPK